MQVNIISTNNNRGNDRRKLLLPQLPILGFDPIIHIGSVDDDRHGSERLWCVVKTILVDNQSSDYVVIMEDDCTFRTSDVINVLLSNIEYCKTNNIHALFTGCSRVARPEKVLGQDLLTISAAHNSQLVVIFKPLYKILIDFPGKGNWDLILSAMSQLEGTSVGLTLPYLTGQLKTGDSGLNPNIGEEIGERFEIEEARLLELFNNFS